MSEGKAAQPVPLAGESRPQSKQELAKLVDDALKRTESLVREARKIGRSLSGMSEEDLRIRLR